MYLIIGANGFLGSYILKEIKELTNDNIIATCRDISLVKDDERTKWIQCDVADYGQVNELNIFLKNNKDIKVIYLAAYHHPDMVEKNPKVAWNINVTSLSNFINSIDNVKCLFYPSTDSVYGNGDSNKHFKEEDTPNPVNRYGRQKVVAESIVNGYGYNVVRYPFLIAPSLLEHKKHFYDQIVDTIKNNDKMEMFEDSLRSSLDFDTAAKLLIELIENYDEVIPKVLNISGDHDLSKYDIGLMIAEKFKLPKDLIVPISSDKTAGIFEAKRAKSTLLDNTKIKKVLNLKEIKINI